MPICRGHGCQSTELIDAHIYARGFSRDILAASNTHVLLVSESRVRQSRSHGVYDQDILCAKCDGLLGNLDKYGLELCRRFPAKHRVIDNYFEMDGIDGDRFATFILSILWRASISNRPELAYVSLGPHEKIAGEVVFGARPLSDMPSYQLIVCRYEKKQKFDPADNYTSPAPVKLDELNTWQFALHGFSIVAKIDRRPFSVDFRPMIVNGNTKLVGPLIDFLETIEGKSMMRMAKAHKARGANPR